MAAIRVLTIMLALLGFFLVGTPLQWLVARVRPASAHRIPIVFCRSLLRLIRVRLEVDGVWHEAGPVMIVPNHISWIDILALGALTPFCFLAKSEISRWPIVSAFAAVQGTIFVERTRRRSIPVANRAMAARMLDGRPVLLFPEGTTMQGPLPGSFQSSHFAAARDLLAVEPAQGDVAVQPVAIAYSRADAAWVGDEALVPHVWRVLRQPPLTCRIRFGTPIRYRLGSDRKTVARQARDAVAAMLEKTAQVASAPLEHAQSSHVASHPLSLAAGS